MNTPYKALSAGLMLAALIPFAALRGADAPKAPDPTPAPETPLHEIGAAQAAAPTPTPTPHHRRHDDDTNRFRINGSTHVAAGESIDDNAVAINGDLTVDGSVSGNGVAVFGDNVVNGSVDGNDVAVVGSTTINGTVHGNAVAVMGTLTLGPNARVDGNAVSVGGDVVKAPSATVGGEVVPVYFGMSGSANPEASALWRHGLRMGRPLAFGPHLHVFWVFNLLMVGIYLLLALVFPNGVRRCADTLAHRPGITFLTGFLAMLGLPVLFILLLCTVIGIPVAVIVLPLGFLAAITFGKAAVYSLIGRAVAGKDSQAVASVMVGILVVTVLYLVPVLGLMVFFLVSFLGMACALATLFSSRSHAAGAAVPPGAGPGAPAAVVPAVAAEVPPAPVTEAPPAPAPSPSAPESVPAQPVLVAVPATPLPPRLSPASEASLPRAGFWIRMLALMIDAILVGILTHMSDWFLPLLALYGALLWHLRGATVGGIIFGLKVVRVDGRPSDWVTMAVRALACFFSLIVVGLGFLWIAFDPQKQAWHDKIAGTVVVRAPKPVSLV
jgi:uncharacterized RDD family membrane protein YckC/cytoskeletal protein CcmA (bactofilin family)